MAGDGPRRGSGESAEFPTGVKEVLAMFVPGHTTTSLLYVQVSPRHNILALRHFW